ncbi:MAG: hypothetical protein HONDAALG_02638 [Gammaproteobacteria bacterium]|nr:hypothetical protein [Gammaproteobacteria bacterium]
MVRYEIVPDCDGVSVRIFDAPAEGWRTLFVEKDGMIARYEDECAAASGVRVYEGSDKSGVFEVELDVYLEAAATGRALGACGLPSLVRFGEADHFVYATFTLAELFVRQSTLHIIGYKNGGSIFSAGWDAVAA